LPTTLIGTYDEAMQRIEAQEHEHKQIAMKTLAWVSYAFRPLTLGELQHTLAIEPESTDLDEEDIIDANNITALCAGLIIVDHGTNLVNPVHYTAKNYFETIRLDRFAGYHATITMSCATYLALTALRNASIWAIVHRYPLACYAAQYMGDHARHHPEDTLEPSVLEVIYRLLSHPDKRKPLLLLLDSLGLIKSGFYSSSLIGKAKDNTASLSGATVVNADADHDDKEKTSLEDLDPSAGSSNQQKDHSQPTSFRQATLTTVASSAENFEQILDAGSEPWQPSRMPEVTALHLAASMGLARVAALLIKESGDIDAIDDTGKTALVLAMERGFEKAVEFLVNSGARVDLGSEHGQGIFLLVAEKDWETVSTIIAQKTGAGFPATKNLESTAAAQLMLAAYSGAASKIQNIVRQAKLDLNERDHLVGAMSLFLAIERKTVPVAQTLMDLGVDVNAKDSMSQFSLHRAVRRGHEGMIRLFINHGAEIDCQNDDGRTPWSANVRTGDERILKLLLELGADPNTKGHQGVSELYIAAQNGETQVVKRMLESGTDPSIQTQFDWAPLHWAAYFGHLDCVKLLVEAGADLNPVSDQDASPLDLAIRANQIAIVNMLSRAGAMESRDIQPVLKATEVRDTAAPSSPRKERSTSNSLTKISLTFDKPIQQGMNVGRFIYPATFLKPKDYIYQVSQPLDTTTSSLSIRLSDRRSDMIEYPLRPQCCHLSQMSQT
jgi:ankyrin repeat protein